MALARLALKNLHQKTATTCKINSILQPCYNNNNNSNILKNYFGERLGGMQVQGGNYGLIERFSSSAKSDGKEVNVQSDESGVRKKRNTSRWTSMLPRPFRRPSSLWRRKNDRPRDIDPFADVIPGSSLGNALLEAAENMNRLFENVIPTQMIATTSPSQLMGKFKETDESYKLKYDMPGLNKEDLKVTVDNGVLKIRGERKVEEEDESDDEYFMSYGFYNTSLALPDDAKQEDIRAELKDGVLTITIPKTESRGKDVKEVKVD